MIYKTYHRNHAIIPGREKSLEHFLNQNYKGKHYKWKNALNSNSEDALTWSYFEVIANFYRYSGMKLNSNHYFYYF